MVLNTNTQQSISINCESIELVEEFKYLGSQMSSSEKDFKGQAWGAF